MQYVLSDWLVAYSGLRCLAGLSNKTGKTPFARPILIALICMFMAPVTVLAQTDLTQVTRTWTGLEKFRNQLSEVKLLIEADTGNGQGVPGRQARQPLPPTGGLPVSGTISHQAIILNGRGRGGVAPTEVENIVGDFFPAINLLRFRIDGPWSGGSVMYAVLNGNGDEMALVYTGAGRNNLPYLLSAGDNFPNEVEKFVPGASGDIAAQQARVQAAANSQSDLLQRLQALQTEMISVLASGDEDRGRQLQQELQQLQQEMVDQQRQQVEQQRQALEAQTANGGGTPQQRMAAAQLKMQEAARSGDQAAMLAAQQEYQQVILSLSQAAISSNTAPGAAQGQIQSCPDNIISWANHMDTQGASFESFIGTIQVSNLFRPSVFTQFFGTTFANMPGGEKFDIGMSLQRVCAVQGTDFYTSGNTTALMGAFGEQGGFSMADAGIASLALEHIADWAGGTLDSLRDAGSWENAKQMELLSQPLLTAIWPIEAQAAESQLVEVKNSSGYEDLSQQLNAISGRVSSDGASALREIVALRRGPVYDEFDQTTKNRFNQLLDSEASQFLSAYIDAAPASSVAASSIAALTENKNWYAGHADIFAALEDLSVVAQYQSELGRSREAAFSDLRQQIENDLSELDSRVAVVEYGGDFVLGLDNQYSPSWQALEQRRAERIIEVEREVHVARVGQGPFDPDHPGAVYLNAIYRNDLAMIREEDTTYSQPFRSFMNPLLSESGFFELVPFLTGDLYSAEDMQGYFEREIENITVLDTLAGFFVVSYHHAYAECMDANPVEIEQTVFWDVVTRNGWGDELWRTTESETYYYTLNSRHVAVFNEVGAGQDPEQSNMVSSLFGPFLPQNLKNSFSVMSDALRGLRMGMQQLACDGPQMQQLERNLIALAIR